MASWVGNHIGTQLSDGDADGDGDTDGDDFLLWQSQFSGILPNSGAVAAVPEPPSIILLLGLTSVECWQVLLWMDHGYRL